MDDSHNKYAAPSGPPPTYGSQIHHDAGPYLPQNHDPRAPEQAYSGYGSPQPPQGPPMGGYYNNGPPPGGYYAPNQPQGNYGPPPQGMYYQQQQQPYGQPYGQPPMGYYQDNRAGTSAAEGCCGALLATLACCCCLDLLF